MTRKTPGRGDAELKRDLTNLRVLQFAPRVPWPLDTGARLRNYHLARVLATKMHVTLLAFGDEREAAPDLKLAYQRTVMAPRERGYSFGKILRGAVGGTPLPLLNYTSSQMKAELARTLAADDFDLIQVESIHLMNYLPVIRATKSKPLVVCDWHNIESDLMRQYAEREQSVARRIYARRTARLMSEFERRALNEFDAHLTVSEPDAARLRAVNAKAKIFVVANGVDAACYAGEQSTTRDRVVFVGSMDYHANIDGAKYFARDVWPAIHEHRPELRFTIVGRDPAPEVRALSSIDGVEVAGSVADVRPYYREATAAVVPLNVGGGSRLKILEAMAAGVPVISTTLGAEGLEVVDQENILLADSARQLAESISKAIDNEALRTRLIAGGRALVRARYDWSSLGAKLIKQYEELLSQRDN